jgi:hypothetical protein
MDCSEVKEFLSAYYDDELSSDMRAALAEHLAACGECTHQLQGFRSLSALAERLPHPEPPALIWKRLEEQLDESAAGLQPAASFWSRLWHLGKLPHGRLGLATAATVLIAVGWFGYTNWVKHDADSSVHVADHQMAAVFGEYLEVFRRDPAAAQQILLAKYESRLVDPENPTHSVGYRPAVAGGMPEGYSVESTYVLDMPCCKCVQCNCKRSDGSRIAIFEHDDKEPDWFGDRPTTEVICDGTRCSLVELDDRMAATWRRGKRHITVVGAEDMVEVERLVAWFDDRRGTRLK